MQKENLNVRVNKDLLNQFDLLNLVFGIKRTEIVRLAIEYFLENGKLYFPKEQKAYSFEELLQKAKEELNKSASLQQEMKERKELKQVETGQKVNIPKSYQAVVSAVQNLGKELSQNG